MRAAIHEAAITGDLEALEAAIDVNEVPPVIGPANGREGLGRLVASRVAGSDGLLAEISLILEAPAAWLHEGTPEEMYVWPHLAAGPLDQLGPADRVMLRRIAPASADRMLREGRYTGWRLSIGRDGVWHLLVQ